MNLPSPFDVINCEHFTAGTVGPPGQRVFFLQAGGDGVVVTLRCEKQQVGALSEYLQRILVDLPERPIGSLPQAMELIPPVEEAWTVGGLGLGYDADHDRLILLIEELVIGDAEDEPGLGDALEEAEESEGATARWVLTREQVLAFIAKAQELLGAGRPTCRLCGRPMDPEGHTCPKTNGHRPH